MVNKKRLAAAFLSIAIASGQLNSNAPLLIHAQEVMEQTDETSLVKVDITAESSSDPYGGEASGNTKDKTTDGDLTTFFDGNPGGWIIYDLSTPTSVNSHDSGTNKDRNRGS